ncbi:MAG: hypothetical protein GZ091_16030 [Paludibacter sp.]|nr:hypothetical protein [Paludibacter sp.]
MKFNRHMFWMVVGCILPLLLIFLVPALGISNNITIFIFIAAMFACHLLMPMHDHSHELENTDNQISKKENHEHHQH